MVRLVIALLALFAATVAAADPLPEAHGPHLAMRLVAESISPRAGSDVAIALATVPQPDWHGYWLNTGDAGLPTRLSWTLPKGAAVTRVAWPVPTTLLIAGLMNYIYRTPYAPIATLHVPAGLAAGTALPVTLDADYLVCTDSMCVPEKQRLQLSLTVGDGTAGPEAAAFDGWRRALPRPLGSAATVAVKGGTVRIAIPYPAAAPLADAYFFPLTTGAIDYAAPQMVRRDGDRVVVTTKGKGGAIDGVLRIADDRGLSLHAAPGTIPDAQNGAATAGVLSATLIALLGAVLGGLILNIMPCVFPILSLKALSLVRGHADERSARGEALAYTAGVVSVCVALGAAILALRAGGSAVGWAFQLQNPRMIVVLLLLSVAVALNLAGLFEVPMPRFAGQGGRAGSFATGALAAFVATPCSGPFMGVALGAALLLPWPAALAVFAGLGIGLALPFLAIGYIPALRRLLPKPGGWMETFRHILSVPMWLTAIALVWVLGRLAGIDGMTDALIAALLLGLVLWVGGRRQMRGLPLGVGVGIALLGVTALGVWQIGREPRLASASTATVSVAGTEPFTEAKLATLRARHRPVFAYFTADWCLSCKVNEKTAIETEGTRRAFAAKNTAVLIGDWTDGDAALGRFIEAHGRAGVPLYLYYAPGASEPRVLPQVLTPGMLEAL